MAAYSLVLALLLVALGACGAARVAVPLRAVRSQGSLTMHFDEAGSGSSAGLLQRERYVATNRFNVKPGKEAAFEKRWATRKSRLAQLEGFRFFTLMKKRETLKGSDESAPGYVSFTIWEEKDNFDAWRTGEAFKEAHGGGGIMDFVQLLTTALFILNGKPNPAFYDAVHPKVSPSVLVDFKDLRPPAESGWRVVEADGVNVLPPDLVVVQDRYAVGNEGRAAFESSAAGAGQSSMPGFFCSFVQRRDAPKADDGANYILTSLWRSIEAYKGALGESGGGSAAAAGLGLGLEPTATVLYDAKLALLSSSGP